MIQRNSYVDRIMAFADTPLVKILTGVRRCGKSTILAMIRDRLIERGAPAESILTYRFDSMEYDGMTAAAMYRDIKGKLAKDGRTYLFLDEVQEIKGWEKVVNSLQADFDTDIYVTGSNSAYSRSRSPSISPSKRSIPRLKAPVPSSPTTYALAGSPRLIFAPIPTTRSIPSSAISIIPPCFPISSSAIRYAR